MSIRLNNLSVIPKEVKVRTFSNFSISFSLDIDLPNGSCIIFRFRGGRNNKNDWYFLQTFDSKKKGYITLNSTRSVKFIPLTVSGKDLLVKFLICAENGVKKGTDFHLKIYNTLVQSLVEENKKLEVLIEKANQKLITIENNPLINIINESFHHITIICPSIVNRNEEFKVLMRIEDEFKNLVKEFKDIFPIFLVNSKQKSIHVMNVKFQKENGGILLKRGLKVIHEGIYWFEAIYNDMKFKSNPIICRENAKDLKLYWGYIHGHTNKSDGVRSIEDYFQNLKNAGLDFGTSTEHDHVWETSVEDFEEIKTTVRNFYEENGFVTLFGYEWGSWYKGYGDICIYYYDDNIPIFSSDLNKYNSTEKLIKNLKLYEGQVLMIGHHTALRPGFRNWDYFDNSLEKIVEIYSTWGNQEYSNSDGNPIPPRYKFFGYGKNAIKRGAIIEKEGSFVQDALKRGYKLGFIAGGDDHFGIYPSGMIDPDNGLYTTGIAAVWAKSLTKKAIWEGLVTRKCYGTTGPRVIIDFFINDYFMGEIIDLNKNTKLIKKRVICLNIISQFKIKRVELIRNNEIFKKEEIDSNQIQLELVDNDNFKDIADIHSNGKEKFLFYYIRIFLSKNHMAWSSPIWLTLDTSK